MNKRLICAGHMKERADLLKCPLCDAAVDVADQKSFICKNGHTFDISRDGYVNLFTGNSMHTQYDKKLFQARRNIITVHEFFAPLLARLCDMIDSLVPARPQTFNLLDMGCGEGSHLAQICHTLNERRGRSINGFGIDLAKEGIRSAARHYPEQCWMVADLAHPPFRDGRFDCLLNLLSPSNYRTFRSLLKTGGSIIKVLPGDNYLKELRLALYGKKHAHYSNEETRHLFQKHYRHMYEQDLHYTVDLNHDGMNDLLLMTPLAWKADPKKKDSWLQQRSARVTVDFVLLIGEAND